MSRAHPFWLVQYINNKHIIIDYFFIIIWIGTFHIILLVYTISSLIQKTLIATLVHDLLRFNYNIIILPYTHFKALLSILLHILVIILALYGTVFGFRH